MPLPKSKPMRGVEWLTSILNANKKAIGDDSVVLIGIRGYFRDTMGAIGKNDRGIYDDALFWLNLKTGFLASYNGNVDPSGYRKGVGTGSAKGMAQLKSGAYRYKTGIHNGSKPHAAFRQADVVTVIRDGTPTYEDTGFFGINIHRGGQNSTSSLGCQTIPPVQWDDFKETGYALLKNAKQNTFCYILETGQG